MKSFCFLRFLNKTALICLPIFAFVLGACAAQSQALEIQNTPEEQVVPSETVLPNPSATIELLPSPIVVPITGICSPLFEHELARIQEYVSNPFAEPVGSNLETGHHGTDFSYYRKDSVGPPIDGTPIQVVLAGRVAGLGFDRLPYGNMIIIETNFDRLPAEISTGYEMKPGSSLYLLYGHMLEGSVFSLGEEIECGASIGQVGGSGFSGNPHLHLETRVGPSALTLATMAFYDTTATTQENEAYQNWRFAGDFTLFDPMILLSYSATVNGE